MDGFERLIHKIKEEDNGMCIITVYDNEEQDGEGMTGYYKLLEYELDDPVYKVELYDFKDGDLIPTGVKLDIDVRYAVISNMIVDEDEYEESDESPVEDDE